MAVNAEWLHFAAYFFLQLSIWATWFHWIRKYRSVEWLLTISIPILWLSIWFRNGFIGCASTDARNGTESQRKTHKPLEVSNSCTILLISHSDMTATSHQLQYPLPPTSHHHKHTHPVLPTFVILIPTLPSCDRNNHHGCSEAPRCGGQWPVHKTELWSWSDLGRS